MKESNCVCQYWRKNQFWVCKNWFTQSNCFMHLWTHRESFLFLFLLLPYTFPSLFSLLSSGDGISLLLLLGWVICIDPLKPVAWSACLHSFYISLHLFFFFVFFLSARQDFLQERSRRRRRKKWGKELKTKASSCVCHRLVTSEEFTSEGKRKWKKRSNASDEQPEQPVYFHSPSLTRQRVVIQSKSLLSQSSQVTKDALNYDFSSFSVSLSFSLFNFNIHFNLSGPIERSKNTKIKARPSKQGEKEKEKKDGQENSIYFRGGEIQFLLVKFHRGKN